MLMLWLFKSLQSKKDRACGMHNCALKLICSLHPLFRRPSLFLSLSFMRTWAMNTNFISSTSLGAWSSSTGVEHRLPPVWSFHLLAVYVQQIIQPPSFIIVSSPMKWSKWHNFSWLLWGWRMFSVQVPNGGDYGTIIPDDTCKFFLSHWK